MAPLSNLLLYGGASLVLSVSVVLQALNTRNGFYAAAVQIGRSSGAIMILLNFAMFLTLCLGIALKKVFFGQLRPVEVEHLYDRAWFFFTESMLALTVFRDDFDAQFVLMFMLLLFLKCFHWICLDRVEYMDQVPPPGPPLLFHIRINTLLALLLTADVLVLYFCAMDVWDELSGGGGGSGGMVLFASEYSILVNTALTITAKYVINLIDLRRAARMGGEDAPAWEEKGMWVFYVELISDAIKLITYSIFFYTIFTLFSSLPINHLHSLYSTIRSFLTKLRDAHRYRTAARDMDERFPDATEEEVARLGGGDCVICREAMVARETVVRRVAAGEMEDPGQEGEANTPKKLPCGHVLGRSCLKSWLARSSVCPTCRRSVMEPAPPAMPAAAVPPTPIPTGAAAPQPGQLPTAPPTAHPTVQVPLGGPLSIWGTAGTPLHAPMGLAPRPPPITTGNGWGPGGPPWARQTQPPLLPRQSYDPSSPLSATTPTVSQAPAIFSPPSAKRATLAPSSEKETPAQMAAAAAIRRLQNLSSHPSSSGSGPSQAPTLQRLDSGLPLVEVEPERTAPYLVPVYPGVDTNGFPFAMHGMEGPGAGEGKRTPRAIIASLAAGFEELKEALRDRFNGLQGEQGGSGEKAGRGERGLEKELEEEMKDLEMLDRRLGEAMGEVGRGRGLYSR